MPRIKKILAPTDFSDVSKLGVRYALEMARDASAEVVVYHAIEAGGEWKDNPSKVAAYHDMLEEGCGCWESLLPIISPTAAISSRALRRRVRHTAQNIVEKAADEAVDMIVMSTHGRTGVNHFGPHYGKGRGTCTVPGLDCSAARAQWNAG